MSKNTQSVKKPEFTSKWIALEDEKIIAEGLDLAEVYTNAMIKAKSKPQFKRISV